MTKQTIEVEGLPEGWKAVAFRKPIAGENYIEATGNMGIAPASCSLQPRLIVEKIQPRRIVLEETDKDSNPSEWQRFEIGNKSILIECDKILRQVKETGIPLHNDEPKLSLSIEECKELCVPLSPGGQLIRDKIIKFIKDK